MLRTIDKLSLAEMKAIAKDVRVFIEPDKARTNRILKECDLRKYLVKEKKVSISGISDVVSILESNYSLVTITRLLSKIQKSVVFDTCLCRLPFAELEALFHNSDENIIITTSMYEELLRLANSPQKTHSVEAAKQAVLNIIEDSESTICTIVDIPPEDYVDNQLLAYCVTNNYSLYTYDYVMGLRARVRNIDVKIYNDVDPTAIPKYTPNPDGPNVVLGVDLLNNITLTDMIFAAEKMGANKFVLTYEFIELLEKSSVKSRYRDLIRFFVYDDYGVYSIYAPYSQHMDMSAITDEYNAVVFSCEIQNCIQYKTAFIPYRMLFPLSEKELQSSKTLETTSPDANVSTISTTIYNVANTVAVEASKNKPSNSKKESKTPSNSKIPYYIPESNCISFKGMPLTEKIWVIDDHQRQQKPLHKKAYSAMPGYTIIHGINHLDNSYKIDVYKIVVNNGKKCGNLLFTSCFSKDSTAIVEKKYRRYAEIMTLMT